MNANLQIAFAAALVATLVAAANSFVRFAAYEARTEAHKEAHKNFKRVAQDARLLAAISRDVAASSQSKYDFDQALSLGTSKAR